MFWLLDAYFLQLAVLCKHSASRLHHLRVCTLGYRVLLTWVGHTESSIVIPQHFEHQLRRHLQVLLLFHLHAFRCYGLSCLAVIGRRLQSTSWWRISTDCTLMIVTQRSLRQFSCHLVILLNLVHDMIEFRNLLRTQWRCRSIAIFNFSFDSRLCQSLWFFAFNIRGSAINIDYFLQDYRSFSDIICSIGSQFWPRL